MTDSIRRAGLVFAGLLSVIVAAPVAAAEPDSIVRLTFSDGAMNGNACVRADGRIAFVSNRTGAWQVWVMNADGSAPRALTSDRGNLGYASWTADGRGILFHRFVDGRWRLFEVDAKSAAVTELQFDADRNGAFHRLRPSERRDGRALIFDRRAEGADERFLELVSSARGAETVLVAADAYHSDARWSRDGRRIVWHAGTGDSLFALHYQIFTMRADGRERRMLTGGEASSKYPQWSPDGRRIAYSVEDRANPRARDVWIMDADGSNPRRLTDHPGIDFDAAWTPDGRALIFTTDRWGGRELARIAVPKR